VVKEKWSCWSSSSVGIAAPLAPRCAGLWVMRPKAHAAEENSGPAAVRHVPRGHLSALPVHALGALSIVVVLAARDVGPRQVIGYDATYAAHVPRHPRERTHHGDQHPVPVIPLERGGRRPVEPDERPLSSSIPAALLR